MNTPTHALINWTLSKSIKDVSFPKSAVLLGSIAPDIPLYFLSIGGALWFRFVEGWEPREIGQHIFGYLFYNDPTWIALHNCLHSPLSLLVVLATLFYRNRDAFLLRWWPIFFLSCLLHTLVDIPVHHDDGPLVFWPLNWSYRFASPISYWDPEHFGKETMTFEACLCVVLVVYNVTSFWRGYARKKDDY